MEDKSTEFNISNNNNYKKFEKPKKVKKTGFFSHFIFPMLFGIIGAFLGIYLVMQVASLNSDFSKFMGLDKLKNNNGKTTIMSDEEIQKTYVNLEDFNKTSVSVANQVLPSIVNIKIGFQVNSVFGGSGMSEGSGSGVILSEDGYILTNNHVVSPASNSTLYSVSDASEVTVTFSDDSEASAEIIGTDPLTDLAVIKVDKEGLKPAKLGDSDKVQIGEFVMAVGSPLGFKSSVTDGIVSAVNRSVDMGDGNTFNTIQTNASINSGNSGGALVNSQGEVVGINTLKIAGDGIEGIGFAIPINDTRVISEALITHQKVERPTLGFSGIAVSDQMVQELGFNRGIYVSSVISNSTAGKAGVKEKDIVTKFNGQEIKSFSDIERIKTNLNIGDEVTFTVIRGDDELDLKSNIIAVSEEDQSKETEQNQNDSNNSQNSFNEFFNILP